MPATLTLDGRKFVVIPQGEYRELQKKAKAGKPRVRSTAKRASAQEAGDVAESKRRLKGPRRIPADAVFNRLGVQRSSRGEIHIRRGEVSGKAGSGAHCQN
jgi:hypothetical protein